MGFKNCRSRSGYFRPDEVVLKMVVGNICAATALGSIQNSLFPIIAIASTFTTIIIALVYAFGEMTSNPKALVWAKTEIFQLFISAFAALVLVSSLSAFCAIDVSGIYSLFSSTPVSTTPATIFDGAENYFVSSGSYINNLTQTTRYHLGGYFYLQSFHQSFCDATGFGERLLLCTFGSVTNYIGTYGGSVGYQISRLPESGYGFVSSSVFVAFNSILFSHIASLNYALILRYLYSGLPLVLLPLGLFLRSMPFMRGIGATMISISFSFLVIYPLVLSVFNIDLSRSDSVLAPCSPSFVYVGEDINSKVTFADAFDQDEGISNDIFSIDSDKVICGTTYLSSNTIGDMPFEIAKTAGNAFLLGVFIPSMALLAAVASIGYLNRFLGEEIDLSRIIQMV